MGPLALCLLAQTTPVLAVGLAGSAPAAERAELDGWIARLLRGVDGLELIAVSDPSAVLGPAAAERLASCADDACRLEALGPLVRGPAVLGALDRLDAGRVRLELRVLTSSAAPIVRVSRDLSPPLEPGVIEAVRALFPDRALRPTAPLAVEVDVPGAAVEVDGRIVGVSPLPAVSVELGERRVRALAPSGRVEEATVLVSLAAGGSVAFSLRERHTLLPFALGGGAVVAAGGAMLLGGLAAGIASDWREACPEGGACATGYTRERYASDGATLDAERVAANVLFVTAGGLLFGAVLAWFLEGEP